MEDIRIGLTQLLVARLNDFRQELRIGLRHVPADEEPPTAAVRTTYA